MSFKVIDIGTLEKLVSIVLVMTSNKSVFIYRVDQKTGTLFLYTNNFIKY